MEGALLLVVQEIVLLVRGTRGVPAATSAGLVERREGQDHRFLLLLAVEVARTLSVTIGLATGTIVRMGEHPIAAGALVDRVTRGHVVKEVRKNTCVCVCGAFKDHCSWLLLKRLPRLPSFKVY